MHWRVAVGASDAHAMSVVASALEAHGGVTMVAPLEPMVAPLVPCRALSLSHTSLGSGRGSANESRERRRVVLHGWVRRLLSKSYRTRGCYVDLKPQSETPTRRRRRCAARAIPRARDESIAIGETRAGGTARAGRGRGALRCATGSATPGPGGGCVPVRSAVLRAA
mgnify:CR=1 FL=1